LKAQSCWILVLGGAAAVLGSGSASAQAKTQREDPSRPGRPARTVGWYMRAGLGIGRDSADVQQEVDFTSPSAAGRARFENRYGGFGARFDAIGALRVKPALIGIAYVLGNTGAEPSSSARARSLGFVPSGGREWWLVGPMGGVQLGRSPSWVVGAMMGWGRVRTAGFDGPEGTQFQSHRVNESLLGVSAWGGPCWPLGRGWMLGLHARVTGVRSDLKLEGHSDTGSEVALLADISFQSP
jgi:hypothetical protein